MLYTRYSTLAKFKEISNFTENILAFIYCLFLYIYVPADVSLLLNKPKIILYLKIDLWN